MLMLLGPLYFSQDDSGWQQVAKSLAENIHLKELQLGGCDAFLCVMGKALAMNTSLHRLRLNSKPLPCMQLVTLANQ